MDVKRKLRLPLVLAVVVLAGCGESHSPVDASVDASVDAPSSDASGDACPPNTAYDPSSGMCMPLL